MQPLCYTLYAKQHDHPAHISWFEYDSWQLTDQRFLRFSQRGLGLQIQGGISRCNEDSHVHCATHLLVSPKHEKTSREQPAFCACNIFFFCFCNDPTGDKTLFRSKAKDVLFVLPLKLFPVARKLVSRSRMHPRDVWHWEAHRQLQKT